MRGHHQLVERLDELEAVPEQRLSCQMLAGQVLAETETPESGSPQQNRRIGRRHKQLSQPPATLDGIIGKPELLEGGRQPQAQLRVVACCPVEGGSDVVELVRRQLELGPVAHPVDVGLERAADELLEQPSRVRATQLVLPSRLVATLGGELVNRLVHRKPVAKAVRPAQQQTLIQECLQLTELGAAHLLGCLDRAAAPEHRKECEEGSLCGAEQLVRPVDRGPKRRMPRLGVAPCGE